MVAGPPEFAIRPVYLFYYLRSCVASIRAHSDCLFNYSTIQTLAFLAECTEEATAAGLKGPAAQVRSMVPRLIRSGRAALCLQSFYTAGPKEVRAWTIMKGTLAPQAAGVIHTDLERGFIKAEVASFDDFKELHAGLPSMAKVKEAGKYRQEGKAYVMQEGDIVVFMHNTTTAKKK